MIVSSLFDALSGPLWMSVYASGKIKSYQITISCLLFSTLILAYLVAKLGYNPIIVLWIKPLISVIIYLYRIQYCHKNLGLSLIKYSKLVISKCLLITIVSIVLSFSLSQLLDNTHIYLIIKVLISLLITISSIFLLGLTSTEKGLIYYKYINKTRKQ